MSKALVVLSGGQDSVTCLFDAISRRGVENVDALTVDYGQRHSTEIQAAKLCARLAGVDHNHHEILHVPERTLVSTSPLTDRGQPLEQYNSPEEMAKIIGSRIEKTFVPMRNPFFLTLAANRAVAIGAREIWTGVCQEDNANYPDCRETFVQAMEEMINEALGLTRDNFISIVTPLIDYDKAETVELAMNLPGCYGALAYSHTAYDGQFPPVGKDHATVLRADGFAKAGVCDPLVLRAHYRALMELPTGDNYDLEVRNACMNQIHQDLDDKWDVLPDASEWL